MDSEGVKHIKSQEQAIIESLLFSVDDPLTQDQVDQCFEEKVDLPEICHTLNHFYEATGTPLTIQNIANGYQIRVTDQYTEYMVKLESSRIQAKLTDSALEVLSIIAYKQPCTKSEIDAIRGVNSYLKTLLEKDLIEIKGRVSGPGRPLLYGTTNKFLEYFGLNSLEALPRMKELEQIINEETGKEDKQDQAE